MPKPRPAGVVTLGSLALCFPASCGAALLRTGPELEQHLARRYRPELETMARRVVTRLADPLHHQRLPDASLPAGSQVAPW